MYRYGKTTRTAIAAMSRLAEVYDSEGTALSSITIARDRRLTHPLVAKILSTLAQNGLVDSIPGPGGGYFLARPPDQITLKDVARLFEKEDSGFVCPFGPDWCGSGDPCPLHDQIVALNDGMTEFLERNTFAQFRELARPVKSRGKKRA